MHTRTLTKKHSCCLRWDSSHSTTTAAATAVTTTPTNMSDDSSVVEFLQNDSALQFPWITIAVISERNSCFQQLRGKLPPPHRVRVTDYRPKDEFGRCTAYLLDGQLDVPVRLRLAVQILRHFPGSVVYTDGPINSGVTPLLRASYFYEPQLATWTWQRFAAAIIQHCNAFQQTLEADCRAIQNHITGGNGFPGHRLDIPTETVTELRVLVTTEHLPPNWRGVRSALVDFFQGGSIHVVDDEGDATVGLHIHLHSIEEIMERDTGVTPELTDARKIYDAARYYADPHTLNLCVVDDDDGETKGSKDAMVFAHAPNWLVVYGTEPVASIVKRIVQWIDYDRFLLP